MMPSESAFFAFFAIFAVNLESLNHNAKFGNGRLDVNLFLSQLPNSPPHLLQSARHHFVVDENCSGGSQ